MSDIPQGAGWWIASDGRWYPPETHPDHRPAVAEPPPQVAAPGWEADATVPPSTTSSPPDAGGTTWGTGEGPDPLMPTPLSPGGAPAEGAPAGRSGRITRLVVGAVVAIVVAGGAWILLSSVFGSGASAGAESPEQAFDQMMAAMDQEDGLGLVSIIDLQEFGVVDAIEGAVGDELGSGLPGGLDLTVAGLDGGPVTAEFRELGGPESGLVVAAPAGMRVSLARTDDPGAGVVVFDRSSVSIFSTSEFDPGSEIAATVTPGGGGFDVEIEGAIDGEPIDPGEALRSEDVPLEMVFIERDGRWFFSLDYTIAHLAVEAGVVESPEWGRWRSVLEDDRAGAASPIEAVTRAVEAFPQLDLEEAMWVVDPVETRLLHDFLPQILDAIDEPVADALDSQTIEIIELELTEEIVGDRADVFLESIVLTSTDEFGDELRLELDGDWCYVVDDGFDRDRGCLDDELSEFQEEFDEQLRDSGIEAEVDLRDLLSERPFLRTTLRSGRWYVSPIDTATTYGEILAESFEGLGEDLRAQVSEDFGVLPAESVGFGDTRTVTVPAGGSAGLGIEFARDEFVETLGGFELSMAAVTFEADDRVELQHGLLDFVDDDAENRIRLRADSPELLVVSSEPEAPRSRGVVFHNRGDEPVTVTVTVREVPYLALDPDETVSGVIDEFGTPWLVDAGFDFGILTGADGFELTFERLPWLEPRAGRPFSNEFRDLVFVVGDPGDRFEVDPG